MFNKHNEDKNNPFEDENFKAENSEKEDNKNRKSLETPENKRRSPC